MAKNRGILFDGRGQYEDRKNFTSKIQQRLGDDPRNVDRLTREDVESAPDYEEGKRYTRLQLTLMADKLLRAHARDTLPKEHHPTILFAEHLKARRKREIYCESGKPDPSIVAGLYWRTHPAGRKWKSPEKMKEQNAGFYK